MPKLSQGRPLSGALAVREWKGVSPTDSVKHTPDHEAKKHATHSTLYIYMYIYREREREEEL